METIPKLRIISNWDEANTLIIYSIYVLARWLLSSIYLTIIGDLILNWEYIRYLGDYIYRWWNQNYAKKGKIINTNHHTIADTDYIMVYMVYDG